MPAYNLNSLLLMFRPHKIGQDCLSFISREDFTLSIGNTTKNWDGTLYSSTDDTNWSEWDGTTTLSSSEGVLYLRGSNNTFITGSGAETNRFVLTGTYGIECHGNIETLLDYQTVLNGNHPTMAASCFRGLFDTNAALIKAPDMPATTLTDHCYRAMYYDCANLRTPPATLPATEVTTYCYYSMFRGCSSLTTAPTIAATTLATYWCS